MIAAMQAQERQKTAAAAEAKAVASEGLGAAARASAEAASAAAAAGPVAGSTGSVASMQMRYPVVFKFQEGFTNAVRRPVRLEDFLRR
jgi:hypothetical protein